MWTQQGGKLVGTGATGSAEQGYSVALSADGKTALIGGTTDNSSEGAAWAFTRSGGVWSQQGSKLVPSDGVGTPQFGVAQALSADGNKAVVGGFTDNSANGAIWAFTRSGSVWTQQGGKVVALDGVEPSLLGYSVSLSADGGTAIAGGLNDNNGVGPAWMFSTGTDFGALNVGAVETANIDVPWSSNFTLGSIVVLTGGASGLDFTLPAQVAGDCPIGFTYAPGESCPVTIQFSPIAPGLRSGAVRFYDNSAPPVLIATVFFNGIGLAPLPGFVSGEIVTAVPASVGLSFPIGVAFDAEGNFYVADTNNSVLREFSGGVMTILAGTGTPGYSGDGGAATAAELNTPENLAFDGAGNLYFADQENNVILAVNTISGIIETVAGSGTQGFAGDGGPATSARMQVPAAAALDAHGNLYMPIRAMKSSARSRPQPASSRPSPALLACRATPATTARPPAPNSPRRWRSRSTPPAIFTSPTTATPRSAGWMR